MTKSLLPSSFLSLRVATILLQLLLIEAQTQSIQRRGRFAVALAGGSLVKIIEEGLLHDDRVCWDKWEVFFTDERLVPLDSPDSTFKAYDDALFSKVPIPAWQIHSIKSLPDIDNRPVPVTAAEEIASDYETSLLASFPGLVPGPPRFDLILLGMGPDGHVASLFPGHQLLEEKDWWISYLTNSPKSPTARITFTLPLLCAARRLAFVCTGASKADALANALDSTVPVESKVPAGRVCLSGHPVVFFVDEDCRRDLEYPRSLFWD
ncbi:nagb/rpia/CoA transferase-like protein [Meredithblackwellia eburnea MCA 4105]